MKKLSVGEWFNRIGLLILFIGLTECVSIPLLLTMKSTSMMQIIGIVGFYLAYALLITAVTYCYRRDSDFKPRKFKMQNILWVIGAYLVIVFSEVVLLNLSKVVYHTGTSKNQEAINSMVSSSHTVLIVMVIGMVFFTPILEETIFRGYLMNAFFKPEKWVLPIIVSGIVFAFAHAQSNILTFGVYFVMGMALAFVYKKTGNLKTSMLLHFIINVFASLGLILTYL